MTSIIIDNTAFNFSKKRVSFMTGNVDLDGLIFDKMCDKYGQKAVCEFEFDFENAVYSDGFINAIEEGLVPELEIHKNTTNAGYFGNEQEYHHVAINGECYKMYFN